MTAVEWTELLQRVKGVLVLDGGPETAWVGGQNVSRRLEEVSESDADLGVYLCRSLCYGSG